MGINLDDIKIMERKEDIIQLLKNADFLEDVKRRLLGVYFNAEHNQWEMISPREIDPNTDERIDEIVTDERGHKTFYTNDAAIMNKKGVEEITALINLLLNPLARLGNIDEDIMLRQTRVAMMSVMELIINNYKKYGIDKFNVGSVISLFNQLLMPLFTHNLTSKPKNVLESLTGLYGEQRITHDNQNNQEGGQQKKII
jgi:hypothetical protein